MGPQGPLKSPFPCRGDHSALDINDEAGEAILPGRIAINRQGNLLAVAHKDQPAISLLKIDMGSAEEQVGNVFKTVQILPRIGCADHYLADTLGSLDAGVTCRDGADNNGDGFADANDPQCLRFGVEADVINCAQLDECADQVDNDGDELIDDLDPDCLNESVGLRLRREGEAPECDDELDNDGDGLIDREDDGCFDQNDNREAFQLELSSCFDGLDNDGDGYFDLADEDCIPSEDPERIGQFTGEGEDLCSDRIDNDDDGLIDHRDPGCHDPEASRYSFEIVAECSDGIDNDGDGAIDYGDDLDCTSANDSQELSDDDSSRAISLRLATLPLPEGDQRVNCYPESRWSPAAPRSF